MGNYRELRLTHEEIELIQKALDSIYLKHLETVRNDRCFLSEEATKEILKSANDYERLSSEIINDKKDV